MFQFPLDPTTPWARLVNEQIQSAQEQQARSYASIYNGFLTSYPGDPMLGQMIPGTQISWEASTECQGLIWNWFSSHNLKPPDDFQAYLEQYAGPITAEDWWNGSYNYFGIPPGTMPSEHVKHFSNAILRSNAIGADVFVPPK